MACQIQIFKFQFVLLQETGKFIASFLCVICSLGQVKFLWTSTLWLFSCPFLSIKFCFFHTPRLETGFLAHMVLICLFLLAFSKEWATGKYFSYFSAKSYVVGTQKNRLKEMVFLITQSIC